MKFASIDIGTNSFLCLIAKVTESNQIEIIHDESKVVRLGQGMAKQEKSQKCFHPEALQRADECLQSFAKTISKNKVSKCIAIATSAARDASNSEELKKICDKYNIPLKIISGSEEAEMSYLGSTYHLQNTDGIGILDIGGGSTEILYKDKNHNLVGTSIDIGAVRLTELYLNQEKANLLSITRLRDFAAEQFLKIQKQLDIKTLIAVAGTPTTLAMYKRSLAAYDPDKIDSCVLKLEYLHQLLSEWSQLSVEERKKIKFLDPNRADIILAGIGILIEALMFLQLQECFVSTKGLRFGALIQLSKGQL